MEDIVIIGIMMLLVSLSALYIYKAKKKGRKCIGCPNGCSCTCAKGETGCTGCSAGR